MPEKVKLIKGHVNNISTLMQAAFNFPQAMIYPPLV
jgi:hypothetical protein